MRIRETILDQLSIAAGQNTKERDYWLEQLAGDPEKSSFPYDFKESAPAELRDGNHTLNFNITGDLFSKLIKLSNASDHMLHMILVAGWVLLLDKYTFNGNGDIIVGSPIYRQEDETEGRLINTVLPLRHRLTPGMTFKGLLLQVRETIVKATEHYSYPMEILLEQLGLASPGTDFPGTDFPLFDSAILVENIHDKSDLEHLRIGMTISFLRTGDNIRGKLEYNTGLYLERTVKWIIKHFLYLMAAVLSNINLEIRRLSILSPEEKNQILYEFNATGKKYPDFPGETIHRWFERQVLQAPGQPALEYAGKELTYHQLNQQANRLAYYLRSKGVKPQGVVGIMMTPCIEMIVGILGILKAGGAYLPIDPTYPQKRILKILNEAGASLLLTKDKARLKQRNREIIFIDNLADTLDPFPKENPTHVNQSHHLLYLISTSGSTGEPKSVMLEHRNIMNLLKSEFSEMGMDFSRGILQFASIGFDVAAQEIFSALLSGGKLWLMDRDLKGDVLRLFDFIRENKISMVFWPPAFLKLVFSETMYVEAFPKTITHIIAAGEQLIVPQSLKEYLTANRVYLVNNYGPAETHVVTSLTIEPTENIPGRPSIGKPISNTAIYVLDKKKNIQPIGVSGELYIAGANVGRGYLNRVELTAQRFIRAVISKKSLVNSHWSLVKNKLPKITNDHSNKLFTNDQCPMTTDCSTKSLPNKPSSRLSPYSPYSPHLPYSPIYRTGDLARWLPDGNIEFIGRVDHQVQIRGFRVELGEIEKRLKEIEHIKEALVLERETEIPGGKNYLCAYVVSEKQVDIPGLRTILSNSLPGFMIPAYFVQISGIPLTTNGKVDRKALPEPGTTGSQDDYTAPGNEIEETLQDIWSALLDIEKHRISVTANFFQLGGHSLKATILIAKVHKAFNLGITLGEMFKKPTIRGLSGYIKSRTGEDRHTSIKPVERKEYYTLSSPQQRLYILQQMDQTATVYNLPLVVGLEGPVDENRLGYTFERLIQRHESFRTSVEMVQGEPVQRIHQGARVEVKIEEKDIGLAASTIENFIRPFDLSRAPLLRVGLIKVEAGKYILMVDMHHIITDGISLRIFTKEFLTLYPGQQLPPLSLQYKDYSQWQTGEEKRKAPGKQEEYWLKQFEGEIPVLALPMDFVRPAVQRFEGKTVTFEIGKRETDAVRQIAAAEGATLFMVLITLYYIFLSKISSQEDIVIGTPVAGRRHTDLEPIIGMFVNTLALRNYPTGEKDFHAFLLEVKERILPAFDNQLYPFEDLVEELGPQVNKDVGRNPLFDVMFVLDDGDITDIKIPGLQLVPYPYENRTAKFDLTLQAIQLEEGLRFNLEYSAALFKEDAIQRFTGYFKRVVSAVVEDVKKKISRIEIISSQEKEQLLVDFNNTEAQYPKNKTIHELFEEQVERIPDRTSLVGGHETHEKHEENHNMSHMSYMSYKELNEKTHRLAFKLKQKGVKPDTIVAIMAERSIETIIGIFGILKAGGAFLFIDPEYPQERVNYVLKDSNAGVLLTTPKLQVKAKVEVKENIRKPGRLPLQFLNIEAFPSTLTSTSTCRVSPTNLAYIIYTSGSTGKPKAVIVGHSSVVNLLFVLQEQYPFRESDAYPLKTSILFDVSVTELFGWFMGGGSLTILGKGGEKDPQMILDTVAKHHITHINFVPSMFHAFLEILNHQNTYKLSHLRYIFLAGEALFPGLVNKFTGLNTKTRLENIYGPTEGTVYSSKFSLSHWDGTGSIPIGAPLRNMKLHILSKDNHLQPVGIPGELCISGVGLARGYLNNPELTAEKFDRDFWDYQDYHDEEKKVPGKVLVLSPHSPHSPHSPYSTIYRTGDLARWLTDGNIEFLGRLDHQVKIRGIRIELEEIENQLLKHEKVKEVVVLAKEDEPGDKYLCAYIVSGIPGSSRGFDVSVLREYLLKSLPAYMIPSYFMGVDEIPLTSSGKIDRKALPEPEVKPGQEYAAPRDETEKKLAELWSVILGIGKEVIGINDSFFYLGGHSLKALHMLNAIQKEFNVKIDFQDIFRYPTIAGLSRLITKSDPAVDHEIQPQPEKEYYDVSYSQWRLMVLYQLDPDSPAFNLPVRVTLYESMDETMIVKVLEKLVKRHASFRTYFKSHQGEPVQIILPQLPVNPEAMDLSHLSDTELEKNRQQLFREERLQPFKLDIPPLFRVKLIKCREEEFDLILIMHHIITDGWSMDVLKHEFTLLYEAYKKGEEYHPAPVKIRYFDYVYWHNRLLGDKEKMRQAKEFWKSQLKSDCPILELPYDYSKKNLDTKKSAAYRTVVPEKTVQELRKVAKACSASLFMVLLAGYNIMLSRITGQQDILLAVPGAARQHEDLKNIVGMFVNTLIVRNKPNPGKTFISFLENLQTNTLKVLEHQSYPLELLCSEFNITYPEIPVFFNMSTFGNTPGENLKDFASYHIEEVQQAKFDIVSYIVEYKNGIEIDTHYYKELFKPMTIEKTMKMYLLALENIVKEPGKKIEAYNLMARERKLKFSN